MFGIFWSSGSQRRMLFPRKATDSHCIIKHNLEYSNLTFIIIIFVDSNLTFIAIIFVEEFFWFFNRYSNILCSRNIKCEHHYNRQDEQSGYYCSSSCVRNCRFNGAYCPTCVVGQNSAIAAAGFGPRLKGTGSRRAILRS